MPYPSPQTVVGQNVRALRLERDMSQDALALKGRQCGMTWGLSSVQRIENGGAAITLQTVVVLAAIFEVPISSLLEAEAVEVTPRMIVRGDKITEWLQGAPVRFGLGGMPDTERTALVTDALKGMQKAVSEMPDISFEELEELGETATPISLAEKRAGKRLGISGSNVQLWARYLWGRTLDEEAAHRAGVGASPQKRGYIVRGLVAEIEEHLRKTRSQSQQMARTVHKDADGVIIVEPIEDQKGD